MFGTKRKMLIATKLVDFPYFYQKKEMIDRG